MPSYKEQFSRFRGKFDAESHFLHLVIPSVVRPGEPFALRAVMMDARGMPDEQYAGRIPLGASDPALKAPDCIDFTPDGLGMARVDGLVADREGAFYLTAEPEGCPGAPPRSNATLARPAGPRLWWGDTHVHTTLSNCHRDQCKDPEFCYWYGRRVALLDFCAAADHLRGIHAEEGNWDEIKDAARRHNAPGEFATFLAFESSHARGFGGDNNIYYNADEAEHFWRDREDMKGIAPKVGLDELWAWLDERGLPYLSIPHHTGRAGKYRDFEDPFHNPDHETVLEIYSWWGGSEGRHDDLYLKGGKTDRKAYWRDALELGYRLGVIGSSDTHHTMPGTPFPVNAENYGYGQHRLNCQGVAAVYADELERGQLFASLLERRCYASTFWRPVLEFSVNGTQMGGQAEADAGSRACRRISGALVSERDARIALFRNNERLAETRTEGALTRFSFTDDEPLESACIRGAARNPEPFAFYYLKVLGPGDQMAWSSPVWISP